jgi:hypothetical protein
MFRLTIVTGPHPRARRRLAVGGGFAVLAVQVLHPVFTTPDAEAVVLPHAGLDCPDAEAIVSPR